MLIYMYSVEIQVYRVHVRRLAIMKNHWGTTGMPEIILIHTCTLCILSFSSQKGKAKKTNFQTFSAIKRVLLST